jgi:hypothetical protein
VLQAWFSLLFSYPLFYQQFTLDLYQNFMVNTNADDTAFVQVPCQSCTLSPGSHSQGHEVGISRAHAPCLSSMQMNCHTSSISLSYLSATVRMSSSSHAHPQTAPRGRIQHQCIVLLAP